MYTTCSQVYTRWPIRMCCQLRLRSSGLPGTPVWALFVLLAVLLLFNVIVYMLIGLLFSVCRVILVLLLSLGFTPFYLLDPSPQAPAVSVMASLSSSTSDPFGSCPWIHAPPHPRPAATLDLVLYCLCSTVRLQCLWHFCCDEKQIRLNLNLFIVISV